MGDETNLAACLNAGSAMNKPQTDSKCCSAHDSGKKYQMSGGGKRN